MLDKLIELLKTTTFGRNKVCLDKMLYDSSIKELAEKLIEKGVTIDEAKGSEDNE